MALTRIGKTYYSKKQNKEFTADPGRAYFRDESGRVLERPDATNAGLADLLERGGQSDFLPVVNEFADVLGISAPDPGLYNPVDPDSFSDQAEDQIGDFFDKELELVLKEINLSREHLKEQRDIKDRRNKEDEVNYDRIENKSFAQTLRDAQLGYTGRGTYDSGFRHDALDDTIDLREENLDEAQLGFDRTTEDISQAFEQGSERLDVNEERSRHTIAQNREQALESRKARLAEEERQRRQAEINQFSELLQEGIN